MADVTYLRRHHHHEPDDDQTLIPLPYWPSTSDLDFDFDLYSSDPEFPSNHSNRRFSRENFVMDLFQQRVEQSQITNHTDPIHQSLNDSVFDSLSFDLGFNPSDLHLDLNIAADEDGDDFPDITVSRSDPISGLRIVEIDSDSECEEVDGNGNGDNVFCGICMHSDADEDDFNNVIEEEEIGSFPLRWDSLHLEDDPQIYEDFEWEEVDGGGFDDREILGLMFAGDDDDNNNNRSVNGSRTRGTSFIEQEEEHEEEDGEEVTMLRVDGEEVNMMRVGGGTENLDWQVLLNSASPETYHVISEPDFGDNDDYIYTAEYEMMFGQFADNVNSFTSKPPASVAFVENLPSVVVTKEDVDNNNALCAVCKDEFAVVEEVKLLPCSHRYHGDCIMPWLGIRNTCPVCRCEFPTDDADYELRKAPMLARSA